MEPMVWSNPRSLTILRECLREQKVNRTLLSSSWDSTRCVGIAPKFRLLDMIRFRHRIRKSEGDGFGTRLHFAVS